LKHYLTPIDSIKYYFLRVSEK